MLGPARGKASVAARIRTMAEGEGTDGVRWAEGLPRKNRETPMSRAGGTEGEGDVAEGEDEAADREGDGEDNGEADGEAEGEAEGEADGEAEGASGTMEATGWWRGRAWVARNIAVDR